MSDVSFECTADNLGRSQRHRHLSEADLFALANNVFQLPIAYSYGLLVNRNCRTHIHFASRDGNIHGFMEMKENKLNQTLEINFMSSSYILALACVHV